MALAQTYDSLGVLSPNDVVFITGKDPSGAWMQIEFANAPDGKGWVASEFLKVDNLDSLPVIGNVEQAVSPTRSHASQQWKMGIRCRLLLHL